MDDRSKDESPQTRLEIDARTIARDGYEVVVYSQRNILEFLEVLTNKHISFELRQLQGSPVEYAVRAKAPNSYARPGWSVWDTPYVAPKSEPVRNQIRRESFGNAWRRLEAGEELRFDSEAGARRFITVSKEEFGRIGEFLITSPSTVSLDYRIRLIDLAPSFTPPTVANPSSFESIDEPSLLMRIIERLDTIVANTERKKK